jgi:hypothetical protein
MHADTRHIEKLVAMSALMVCVLAQSAQGAIPGQIIVYFRDGVSEAEAGELVDSYGLSWEPHFPVMSSYQVIVSSDSTDYYIAELESKDIVMWVDDSGESGGYEHLIINFREDATQAEISDLIGSFNDMEFNDMEYEFEVVQPRWGVVEVPEGEEQDWIDTFEEYDTVRFAELDTSGETPNTATTTPMEPAKSWSGYAILFLIVAVIAVVVAYLLKRTNPRPLENRYSPS